MKRSDNQARLTDLIMVDGTELQLYQSLPAKYLTSTQHLSKAIYSWRGEIQKNQLRKDDIPVVINTFAYRARHQSTAEIKRIRTGGFRRGDNNIPLKIVGVIRDNQLLVVTEYSSKRFSDVAPRQPVRVNGIYQAENYIKNTFSSTNSSTNPA